MGVVDAAATDCFGWIGGGLEWQCKRTDPNVYRPVNEGLGVSFAAAMGSNRIEFTIHYAIDSGRLGAKQGATAMPAQSTWLGWLKMPIDVGLEALRREDGYIADAPGKLTGRPLQALTGHEWRGGRPRGIGAEQLTGRRSVLVRRHEPRVGTIPGCPPRSMDRLVGQ